MPLILKIVPRALWLEAEENGLFLGAPIDRADGFIHFSTPAQVEETAAKHFAGEHDLLLVAVDPGRLGEALRSEPSRGGDLFPHLYTPLIIADVAWVKPLPLGADGRHDFSGLLGRPDSSVPSGRGRGRCSARSIPSARTI